MKKSIKLIASILLYGVFIITAIGSGEDEKKESKKNEEENLNLISEDKIGSNGTGKTFKSGYFHLQFKLDHTVYIYQSSGGSTRGCTAEGVWKIENSILNIKVTKSHCSTRDYSELNGNYQYSAYRKKSNNDLIETIKSSSKSFYHGL